MCQKIGNNNEKKLVKIDITQSSQEFIGVQGKDYQDSFRIAMEKITRVLEGKKERPSS